MSESHGPGEVASFDDEAASPGVEFVDDLRATFTDTFESIAAPGDTLRGHDRIAVAAATRMIRVGEEFDSPLGARTLELVRLAVRTPWEATEDRFDQTTKHLGVAGYLEIVGLVVLVLGVDTATALLGRELASLPRPALGDPILPDDIPGMKRRAAWVPMDGPSGPRRALSAAPRTRAIANRLLDRLYPETKSDHVADISSERSMQIQLVAVVTSLQNKCSYCLLNHLRSLMRAAENTGTSLDLDAIAAGTGNPGIPGGSELVALARSATSARPDPATTDAVRMALGEDMAIIAVERAAGMQMANRLTTLAGQRVPSRQRAKTLAELEQLGASAFPHADMTTRRGEARRIVGRMKRRIVG